MAGLGPELPIPNIRFHGESWRVSGPTVASSIIGTRLGPIVEPKADVIIDHDVDGSELASCA
jgi:hypothetical protein